MSKKIPLPLLGLLMDNQIHSGEEIGALLGVSRAAVWKQLKKIHDLGLAVESLKGRGYRLIDIIDKTAFHQFRSVREALNNQSEK